MLRKKIIILPAIILFVTILVSCSHNLTSEVKSDINQVPISLSPTATPSLFTTPTKNELNNDKDDDIQLTQVEGTNGLWLIQDTEFKQYSDRLERFESWFPKLANEDLDLINSVATLDDLSSIQNDDEFIMLLASIPNDSIYLYGCRQGVILRFNEYYNFFAWDYITPMGILPVMYYADYNGDGQKEIAISIHLGTDTGVSIDSLYLVELKSDGAMQAFEFTSKEYITQLENCITFKYDNIDSMLQFYINGEKVGNKINISEMTEDLGEFREICFGQQICFSITNDAIVMSVTPELYLGTMGAPTYDFMPNISAKVIFEDQMFSLSEFEYEETLN